MSTHLTMLPMQPNTLIMLISLIFFFEMLQVSSKASQSWLEVKKKLQLEFDPWRVYQNYQESIKTPGHLGS